jgi:hypothetical protein
MVCPLPEQYKWSTCMNWVKAITGVLVLWSGTAWGATLTWNANSEPDLAGYRIYQCSQLPCTRASGNASSLATVGTVTGFNIGTPAVTQHYFITAYDFANNESTESGLTTFTPAGSPPPVVPPVIVASPRSLSFAATQGGANPATQTLILSNTGGGSLTWSAGDNVDWLALSPVTGTGNGVVTATVATGARTAGTYNANITVNAIGSSPVTVPVMLTVTTSPPPPPPPIPTAPPTPRGLRITPVQ